MNEELLKAVQGTVNPQIPDIRTGDMVSVHVKIKEGNRERIQIFKGTIIRIRKSNNFTVRRVASNGIGVERTFPFLSPNVDKVEVERHSHVRRSRLYFLRDRAGKASRLKQKFKA